MEVTLQQIAEHSGVSLATVSRVINHTGNVSTVTAAKVKKAADELGYYNRILSEDGKSSSDCRMIALIVPQLSNPFYSDIIDGVQDTAYRNGYHLIVAQSRSGSSFDIDSNHFLRQNIIKGMITLDHSGHLRKLLKNISPDLPVVQCCEYDDRLPYPSVAIDDYSAAMNAVNYLASTGHQKIALFNSTCNSLYGSKRESGYRDALKRCGLLPEEKWIYHLEVIDFNIAYAAALKMFEEKDRPDAVFTVSDVYAAAVIRAAKKAGLAVPKDIAVIGFDNTEISLMIDPPLTTVSQPRYDIGSTACRILLNLIQGKTPASQKLLIETDLIIRSST